MSDRDASPVRKPSSQMLDTPFVQCRRHSHTPTTGEWLVHKPEGRIVQSPDKLAVVSKYNGSSIKWRAEFDYYSDAVAAQEPTFLTQKQATECAEDHRLAMNLEHNVGVAHWRYVRPQHVEFRLTKHPERTIIIERNYWEKWRHTGRWWMSQANVKNTDKHLLVAGTDPLTGANIGTRTVAKHHLGAPKPTKTYMVDGDRLHLCLNNLRVHMPLDKDWPGGDRHNTYRVWAEPGTVGGKLQWRIHGYKYFIIPNGADPNDVPLYVKDSLFTEISVYRENGYLYWKNTWLDDVRPLREDEQQWYNEDEYLPEDIKKTVATVAGLWATVRGIPYY
jgi:hypothetical protein